ncbi:hypothetical protein Pmar_PMAR001205, partial [Perkinsus marinus ATCC 50983]
PCAQHVACFAEYFDNNRSHLVTSKLRNFFSKPQEFCRTSFEKCQLEEGLKYKAYCETLPRW